MHIGLQFDHVYSDSEIHCKDVSCCRTASILQYLKFTSILMAVFIILTTGYLLNTQDKSYSHKLRKRDESSGNETNLWEGFSVDFNETNFLEAYREMCMNITSNVTNEIKQKCPCVPDTIVGRQTVNVLKVPNMKDLIKNNTQVEKGGYWKPSDCYSRDRVAIIIPFRDRQSHLNILLKYLHPLLQRQQIEYRIFVIEQQSPKIFNKASLMNAGFLEARKLFNFDCVVFHDVDMIPEDDRNFYTCMNSPRHVAAYVDKYHYQLPYQHLVGGAVLFKPEEFQSVNGFSNRFYGWGGEDDDMSKRIRFLQLILFRYPDTVARYSMIKHKRDRGNPRNSRRYALLDTLKATYEEDGLNSVVFRVSALRKLVLYTWISVSLK